MDKIYEMQPNKIIEIYTSTRQILSVETALDEAACITVNKLSKMQFVSFQILRFKIKNFKLCKSVSWKEVQNASFHT